MSRTIRRWSLKFFRHPKGAKQAKINNARSIPPDDRAEIHLSDEAWKCRTRKKK